RIAALTLRYAAKPKERGKSTTRQKQKHQQRQRQTTQKNSHLQRFAAFARLKNWVLQETYNADICRRFCGI
ncbi:MAG: hypothetical protein LBC07_03245, partial [Elusimicrobiota bacterium]|nr:hypothetical protein [Elusimicrobiota bacterium]